MTSRVLAWLVLVTLLAVACTPNTPFTRHTAASPTPGKIAWADCGNGFQCATLKVPLDYAHPNAGTIDIALNRKPATEPAKRIGSLVMNPGGPGVSGLKFVQSGATEFSELNRQFDLVGFDPRGVGQSTPVKCQSPQQEDANNALDTVLDDPEEKQAAINAEKAIAASCMERSGRLLPFVDTASVAKDLDQIRAALGDSKLTYLGFSYGTFIAENYAHLFPNRVRALVLDSVMDPTVSANDMAYAQVVNVQQNLDAWIADCRARTTGSNKCLYAQTGDPLTKLTNFLNTLDTTPMHVGNRLLTHGLALQGILWPGLYYRKYWPYLDQALTLAERGKGDLLLAFTDLLYDRHPDGTYDNTVDANLAINCIDWPVPRDVAAFDALGPKFATASPIYGPAYQYTNLQCAFWPVKPTGKNAPITADTAPPILLVAGTSDPATPIEWAQSVNRQLVSSVLLTRQGQGHISYDESPCAQAVEIAYLENLTVPAKGTVCS